MVPVEEWIAIIGIGILTTYTLTGVADFGGGVWDLLASGPRREAQRAAVARAIGPIWEANHVWLIFFLIILFGAFPTAFAALSIALFAPFHLLLLGIVLRGASFVFRAYGGRSGRWQRAWSAIFGAASMITPLLLGMSLGAVSTGGIRVIDGTVRVDVTLAWLSPFSLTAGAITLGLAAYLAAIYLAAETNGPLREDFRRRALACALVLAALLIAGLLQMATSVPHLWRQFWRDVSAPLFAIAAVATLASGWALVARQYSLARVGAAFQAVALLWGWAAAQRPFIIYPDVTVFNAAAAPETLRFVALSVPFGLGLVVPSLWLLFSVFKGVGSDAGTD
ncbi:MAG TPA: cytochrome d ubiquinol oxidase subunit II [Limnochordia bacterium]